MIGGRGRTKRRGSTLWPRLAFDYANDIDQGSSEPEAHAWPQGGRFGRSRDPAVKILSGWSTFKAKNRIEFPLITRIELVAETLLAAATLFSLDFSRYKKKRHGNRKWIEPSLVMFRWDCWTLLGSAENNRGFG